MEQGYLELRAMVGEMLMSPKVPLLVLSCIPDTSSQRNHSSIEISRLLRLGEFNRPWLVQDCVVEGTHKMVDGFTWIVEQAQR